MPTCNRTVDTIQQCGVKPNTYKPSSVLVLIGLAGTEACTPRGSPGTGLVTNALHAMTGQEILIPTNPSIGRPTIPNSTYSLLLLW